MPSDDSSPGSESKDPDFSGDPNPEAGHDSLSARLAALAERLIQRIPPDEMARLVLDHARQLTGSPHGYVGYLDPDSGILKCPAITGGLGESCGAGDRTVEFGSRRGLLAWVREHGQALLSNAPGSDPRAVGPPPGHLAISRVLSVPALSQGRLHGQVTVANAPRDYTQEDQQALERLAGLYALALERALAEQESARASQRLEEEVRVRTAHLQEANQRLQEEMAERQRTEEEIERFFLAAPEFMAVLGLDGYLKRCNPSLEHALGYGRQEMLSVPFLEYAHPDDRTTLRENLEVLARGERLAELEIRCRRKDGSYFWTAWSGMQAAGSSFIYAMGRDITRRKGYEKALRESEELFRTSFEQSPLGAALISLDRTFLRVNTAFCRFLGYSQRELTGRPAREIAHPEEYEISKANLDRLLDGKVDQLGRDVRLTCKDGRVVWGRVRASLVRDGQGRPLYFLSTIQDITEERRAEQERSLTQERQEALLALHRMVDDSMQNICAFSLDEMVRLTGSASGYLFFMSEDQTTLTVHAWSRDVESLCSVPGRPRVYKVAETGLWGEAVRQRRPIITNDYAAPNRLKKGLPQGHPPLIRHLNAPVFEGDRIVAVAGVANKPEDYDESDARLLQLLMEGMWSIIQHRRTQEALKESEALFRQMFENNRSVKLVVDPANGAIVRANQAACDFYGYGLTELTSMNIGALNLLPAGEIQEAMERAVEKDQGHFLFRHRLADGQIRQVEVYSGPIVLEGRHLLYSIVHDVTERLLAEQALRDSEERYRDLVEGVDDLVVQVDEEGRFIFANHMAREILGLEPGQSLGLSVFDFVHPEDQQRIEQTFASWPVEKLSRAAFESRLVSRDGRVHDMLWTANPHYNEAGDLVLINGIARDITERKALEEQARLLEKRQSLAIMAGGVAHDFNNLLQSVLGNADLALLDIPPASPAAEHLREVQGAAQRAADLAHKMLAYSGHTPYIPRPLEVSQLVRDMLPLLRPSLPPWLDLQYDLAAGLPRIEGDHAQIKQALRNLFINAVEALGERSGLICISTGIRFCDREMLASTYLDQGLAAGDYVYLRVDDSGPGMDQEIASKAFDPFFSTKFTGRGLGLAVALGVVKAHQGAVKIEDRPGGGTRVTLYFPTSKR